jgi:hypothetical protein
MTNATGVRSLEKSKVCRHSITRTTVNLLGDNFKEQVDSALGKGQFE